MIIAPEIYQEDITLLGKNLVVRGTAPRDRDVVIAAAVAGSGAGAVYADASTVTLRGNVIAANTSSYAGAIYGDGLPDAWEIEHFGDLLQGADGDPDGDGFSNLREYRIGSGPNRGQRADAEDVLKLRISGSGRGR